jgi:hypothetical protein
MARRAGSQLLWLLVGFALCQVVLAVAIDGWLEAVRDPEYATKLARLKARRAEFPDRPLVLLLGSSRTAYGIDANSLSANVSAPRPLAFNFGLMGGGIRLQELTLRRLLAEGIRPALIFVEVMPALLAVHRGRLLEEKMLDGARLTVGEMLRLRRGYREPRRLLASWCLGRLLPCYRHQAEVRGELGLEPADAANNPNNPCLLDDYGWRARTDEITAAYRSKTTEMALSQYRDFCASDHLGKQPVQALEALLGLCRREGIPAALVLMPEGKPFRELYSAEARAACDGLLDRLRQRWGVKVIDARTWVEDRGFWDTHHLLPPGAWQFTERFGREALQPALQELRPGAHARAEASPAPSTQQEKETP